MPTEQVYSMIWRRKLDRSAREQEEGPGAGRRRSVVNRSHLKPARAKSSSATASNSYRVSVRLRAGVVRRCGRRTTRLTEVRLSRPQC